MSPATPRSSDAAPKGVILIVDDHSANLGFLFEYLERSGFRVLVATDGEEALSQLEHARPDLILLDIMMPGIDGFSTCAAIKGNPRTSDIPVIFMSARTDAQDKVRGFHVGAVDYVDKPVHKEEVLARVTTHVTLRRMQRELRAQNAQFQKQHLELRERNQQLDAFNYMVAHDLRSALSRVLGYADLLLDQDDDAAGHGGSDNIDDLKKIRDSALRMQSIVQSMLALAGMSKSEVEFVPIEMAGIVESVLADLEPDIHRQRAQIHLATTWPLAIGYGPWLERVWANYIGNGLKYGGKPPVLRLGADIESEEYVRFWIRDNGVGLSDELLARVYQPFVRAENPRAEGFGIGLSIVHRIVSRLDGDIGARNLGDGGCEFSFTLRRAK